MTGEAAERAEVRPLRKRAEARPLKKILSATAAVFVSLEVLELPGDWLFIDDKIVESLIDALVPLGGSRGSRNAVVHIPPFLWNACPVLAGCLPLLYEGTIFEVLCCPAP